MVLSYAMTDDDFSLFRVAMRGVKPLECDRAETGLRKTDNRQFARLREAASRGVERLAQAALSDQFVIDVLPEERLLWAANGVQKSQMQRLSRGQFGFDGSLDLHGFNVERAREQLQAFLAEGQRLKVRCARVVHGKASSCANKPALLKSHINSWLRQHPAVLGFASCLPRHGGSGAVYVLLKREDESL